MTYKPRMLLSQFTFEVLKDIVAIYDNVVGGRGSRFLSIRDFEYAKERLGITNAVEWRFGSKITGHSKLWITRVSILDTKSEGVICFRFDGNLNIELDENPEEEKILKAEFEKALVDYLESRDLLVVD